MIVQPIKTRIFKEGENLFDFIRQNIKKIPEKSVLVVTSKIVALSENRTRQIKNHREKDLIIKAESEWAMKTKYVWLTIKDGVVMASAGVDESNANGKLILLPKNSYQSAKKILAFAQKNYGVKKIGVLITDSRLFPLRAGIVGLAVGYAGMKGIKDYRGKPDLFGRKLKMSQVDIADSLATAAVLTMGESNERQPLALIKNASIEFSTQKTNPRELLINPKNDIYAPIFKNLRK
ncbi:MAG: coenzyme F420-0:L-glutamate ligase [Candidatus Liptonbacteria bacterium]|nr:coenzyme F420-0:L-glutamate ligase [Candidatus Liptonbacteria bacterium]